MSFSTYGLDDNSVRNQKIIPSNQTPLQKYIPSPPALRPPEISSNSVLSHLSMVGQLPAHGHETESQVFLLEGLGEEERQNSLSPVSQNLQFMSSIREYGKTTTYVLSSQQPCVPSHSWHKHLSGYPRTNDSVQRRVLHENSGIQ